MGVVDKIGDAGKGAKQAGNAVQGVKQTEKRLLVWQATAQMPAAFGLPPRMVLSYLLKPTSTPFQHRFQTLVILNGDRFTARMRTRAILGPTLMVQSRVLVAALMPPLADTMRRVDEGLRSGDLRLRRDRGDKGGPRDDPVLPCRT